MPTPAPYEPADAALSRVRTAIADHPPLLRDGEPASTYERGWRDALRLVTEALDVTGHRLECICGAPVEASTDPYLTGLWAHTADTGRACQRARPRCPECQMPHPLVPGTPPMCRSIREHTNARPPAAEGLPEGSLESATAGAAMLDATARTPRTRNLLAHALTQLARDGWLRTEPGDRFDPADTDRPPTEPRPADTARETRCASCDHQHAHHDADGRCWFTVDHGTPGSNLVCPCAPAHQKPGGSRVEYRARVRRHQVHEAINEAFGIINAAQHP